MARFVLVLISALLACFAPNALAHQTSDSYLALSLTNGQIEGRWAIALRDLNHVLEIDSNKDGEVSDLELTNARPNIENYAFTRIKIEINAQPLQPKINGFDVEEHSDAVYATLVFNLPGGQTNPDFLITYLLFNDTDPLHRGLFRFDLPDRTETAIFSPAQPARRFLLNTPQKSNQFLNFLREGVWHIWIGFDHILFLVALLLPSVLQRKNDRWLPLDNATDALLNVIKVVTAFTIAHSITLTLATLGWVKLPSRLVESVIAASVVLAASNNIKAVFPERVWLIAFGFGLIHGFGFASVLAELELNSSSLAFTLLGFNLGVELGQLAIVLVFVPLAYALRHRVLYQNGILRYGSLLIAVLASAWFVERALDRRIFPF